VGILWSNVIFSNNPQIHFSADKNSFPANYWKVFIEKGDFKFHSLCEYKKDKAKAIANEFIKRYPQAVFDDCLKNVFIVDSCEKFGLKVGGTPLQNESSIFVVYRDTTEKFSEQLLEGLVHEFSHILHKKYTDFFKYQEWKKNDLVKYGKGGYSAIKKGLVADTLDENYCKNGFLDEYSTSSIEEDFATFSEKLFLNDSIFLILPDKYPLIAQKKDLIIAFYHSINSTFTEVYFKSLKNVLI